jgi:hypothetical protein
MASQAPSTPASSPSFVIDIPVGTIPATRVLAAVDGALAAGGQDVRVRVLIPGSHPERDAIAAACESDSRISLVAGEGAGPAPDGAVVVTLPPMARAGEGTLEAIAELVRETPSGTLELTIPGVLGQFERFGWAARLPGRAVVRATLDPTGAAAAEDGGERIPGTRVGLSATGSRGIGRPLPPPAGPLPHERAEHLRHRARSATYRARAAHSLQRLSRERMRAQHERARSQLLERRLAATGPGEWVAWRGRQAARFAAEVPPAAARLAQTPWRRGRRLLNRAARTLSR